jgi:L-threonylcarbamoyladenylate synthase
LKLSRILDAFDESAIRECAGIIRKGGLIAFPTETVYGLGANAENPIAVAGIFDVKGRPRMDPLIVHVSSPEMALRYGTFPELAHSLMEKFWPGPLTLVVPRKKTVPDIVTAGLDTVAIRIPAHPAALGLLNASGCGIAAPSANRFGYVSPTEASHVAEQLSGKVSAILDGGRCAIGLESTILSLCGKSPCILRPGGTPVEELVSELGPLELKKGVSELPQAPGQLEKHYATNTPLYIVDDDNETAFSHENTGLLCLQPTSSSENFKAVEILSASGNLREAAANLFSSLRRLDGMSLDRIIARPFPEKGLGVAIMDRLRRCSVQGTFKG